MNTTASQDEVGISLGVVFAEQLGITIGQAVRDLELISKVFSPIDMRNRIEFLPYG